MRYKNWACEIPDLDPRGFRPVAGKIRLYGGDGGGGGGDGGAAEAASLGLDIGTPGTSTGPGADTGSGEVSEADIDAAVDAAVEASAKSTPTAVTESEDVNANPSPGQYADYGWGAATSNVVGSENQPGGWQDSSGQGVVSQGMNISLGLDPMHGAIGPYAGTNPNAPNQTAIDVAATLLNMTPEDLLDASGRDEFGAKDYSQLSTSGLDRGTLEAVSAAGYGGLNITDNQTVDQALAAFNTSDALDYAFPGLANALVPGFGTLSSVSKALVGLHQGYLTPGQALAQIGLGILSAKTNIPEGALQQAFGGQYGPLAGGIAQSGLAGAIGQAIGAPAGLVNMGLGAAGVGKSISGAMSDVKGPDLLGPSLDSVGMVSPSAEPSGTAGGDAGGATSGTTSGTTDTVAPPVSSASSANPLGLVALLGGVSSDDEEKEQKNMADVRRGIAMTPYGMPYGG